MGMKGIRAPGFPHLHLIPYIFGTVVVKGRSGGYKHHFSGPKFNITAAFCQNQTLCPILRERVSLCISGNCRLCSVVTSTHIFSLVLGYKLLEGGDQAFHFFLFPRE